MAQGKIEFLELEHDFGTIKEEDGKVSFDFQFVNIGSDSLNLTDVKASCGCTIPAWTDRTVQPGDTGIVTAEFNPFNRPGSFTKTITVTSTAENKLTVLTINGRVIPRPRTLLDDYGIRQGNMRFKSRILNMGKVLSNAPVTRNYGFYNESEDTLLILENTITPEYIELIAVPDTIPPKTFGVMSVTFDPRKFMDLGYSNSRVVFFTNEPENPSKKLSVVATVEEYFPPMTPAEYEKAARLVIDPVELDFNRLKTGNLWEARVVLENTGKSPLSIRKVSSTCSCIVTKLEKEELAPGESLELEIAFNTEGQLGYQQKTITVFCNDPGDPTRTIVVKGRVDE